MTDRDGLVLRRVQVVLTDEMIAVLDHASAASSRNRSSYIEHALRSARPVRAAARDLGIDLPERPADSRGGDRRSEAARKTRANYTI